MSEPQSGGPGRPESFSQDIQHAPVGARVPEDVGRGVFSNATMILQGGEEFVVDFLSTMVQPQQIVARVIMTAATFAQVIHALRENLKLYEGHFGKLTARDTPPPPVTSALPATPAAGSPAAGEAPGAVGAPVAGGGAAPVGPGGSAVPAAPAGPGAESIPKDAPRSAQPHPQPRIEELYEQLKLPDKVLGGVFANLVMIRHMGEEFCFDFVANFYPRPVVNARVFVAAGRIPSLVDAMSGALRIYRQKREG